MSMIQETIKMIEEHKEFPDKKKGGMGNRDEAFENKNHKIEQNYNRNGQYGLKLSVGLVN